jgi:hypothetical protein
MRLAMAGIAVVASVVTVLADDRSITFDKAFDFSTLKTFAVHDTTVASARPELGNPLFARQVADAIRAVLVSKGLKEVVDRPDVVVDSSVTGQDYSIGSAGRANPIRPGRGGPRSFDPVSFTEGTLVIDLTTRESPKLVWHGVYRRPQDSAKKLLSDYPPKTKK